MKNGWQPGTLLQTYGHFHLYEGLLMRDEQVLKRDRSALCVDALSSDEEKLCLGFFPFQQDLVPSLMDTVDAWLRKRMKDIRQTKQWQCETQESPQRPPYESILATWEPAFYLVESCLREIEAMVQMKRRVWQFEGWTAAVDPSLALFDRFDTLLLMVSPGEVLQSTLPAPYYDICVQIANGQLITIGFLGAHLSLEQQVLPFVQSWIESQSTSVSMGQRLLDQCSSNALRPLLQETVTLLQERLLVVQRAYSSLMKGQNL